HKEAKIMINSSLEVVERGQRITSIRKLSDRWKWSTKKVTHFLDQLVKDNMIKYISDSSKTVITIVNYDKYQGKETPLSIDNTSLGEDGGNTEETQEKHQGNTEETEKKHEGNAEEKQKKTNKNDKEYIKNDEEGEERGEGKEEAPVLPSLSFSTEAHKKIYEEISEVSYRSWFIDTEITETDNEITIKVNNDFNREVIRDRFKDKLYYIFLKKIEVI
ncbi:DnaA N-terminal domain-containing protein, partial [Clostridium nigeriense]|uniref:DnaA N-terminal domain-containing protein n=1 Tax=Clostridium nigeriense TaxID=1805470 RepID=UPI003D32A1ED